MHSPDAGALLPARPTKTSKVRAASSISCARRMFFTRVHFDRPAPKGRSTAGAPKKAPKEAPKEESGDRVMGWGDGRLGAWARVPPG